MLRALLAPLGLLLLPLSPAAAAPAGGSGTPAPLLPYGVGPGDWLGHDIALSGARALVGAPAGNAYFTSASYAESGGAWVLERREDAWVTTGWLVPPGAAPGEAWGASVALEGDVAVLGSPVAEAAWVFERGPAGWQPTARLGTAREAGSSFASALAVAGGEILVGAPTAGLRAPESGALHVFARSDASRGGWSEVQVLVPTDGGLHDRFGSAVACSDGRLCCGAWGDGDETSFRGSAYVFELRGGAWRQVAKLRAEDGPSSYYFADSLALAGRTAVIGAWGDDDQGAVSGSAYVFELGPDGWEQTAKLLASDGEMLDFFGWRVALAGGQILVSAYEDDDLGPGSGSVYRFERRGDAWVQSGKLHAPAGAPYDFFGWSLAADGDTALVGAYLADAVGADSGAAWAFPLRATAALAPALTVQAGARRAGLPYLLWTPLAGRAAVLGRGWLDGAGSARIALPEDAASAVAPRWLVLDPRSGLPVAEGAADVVKVR